MPQVLSLADEIRAALSLLREHGLFRAALRLERMSHAILYPKPKATKPKAQPVRLVGGSGRKFPAKMTIPKEDETK